MLPKTATDLQRCIHHREGLWGTASVCRFYLLFPWTQENNRQRLRVSPTTMCHNGLPFLLPACTESAKQDNIWLTLHRVDIFAFSKNHLTRDRKDFAIYKKNVRTNMRTLQCPESSRNLLDKLTTSFCIFPSLLFGWLYWTTHILFFPVNIDHPSSCFLDAVYSVAQYLFCYLLADFKPSHFTTSPTHLRAMTTMKCQSPFD